MADVFGTEDSVFFVSGVAGSATQGGCTKEWFDANFTQLTDIMSAGGGPIDNASNATYSHATKRVTKAGAFTNTEVGMVAYIAGTNITTGRYKVTAVDPGGGWLEASGIVSTGDNADTGVNVGGSFDTLQNALDNTDAGSYTVEIFDNKGDASLAAGIDIDTGSGEIDNGSWKRVIGFHTTPGDMDYGGSHYGEYTVYDGNDSLGDYMFTYANGMENIEMRNIAGTGVSAPYHVHYLAGYATARNLVWRNCKAYDTGGNGWSMGDYSGHHSWIDCIADNCANGFVSTGTIAFLYNCKALNNADGFNIKFGVLVNCISYDNQDNFETPALGFGRYMNCTAYSANGDGFKCVAGGFIETINCISSSNGDRNFEGNTHVSQYCCSYNGGTADNNESLVGDIAVDPQFADAGNGDFRPRNPAVLRGGKSDTAGNETQMGAVQQKYQYPDRGRNRVANFGRLAIIR